ncbi:MAG: sigma 54-interacting transcriptional regulator [Planctomycetota bacterium]
MEPSEPSDEDAPRPAPLDFDAALERVARAGAADVLIQGESGAGKSHAAKRIHALSERSAGPFVVASVAGLADSLLEAELFGHVAGAFTGATEDRPGRFRRAHGGTLVLEAIDALALPLQVKLLRVLQERVVEPVGSSASVPVDVRVVATATEDLARAAREGRFREDLFFRLAVVPLRVPPLRARAGGPDFAVLCRAALAAAAERSGLGVRPLAESALDRLRNHPWPGNLRELENALERSLVLAGADTPEEALQGADFDFLDEALGGAADEVARAALAHGVLLEDLERALFTQALDEERGNVAGAARRLGLTRKAFDYRRKRL